jgi:hypothetical protein
MSEMTGDPVSRHAPLPVTPAVKKKICFLPIAKNQTWVAAIDMDAFDEGTLISVYVFLVDNEKGSN